MKDLAPSAAAPLLEVEGVTLQYKTKQHLVTATYRVGFNVHRGDRFIVALDLPGVDPSQVDVTVERNVVEIQANRQPLRQEGDQVIIDERPQGEFRRQLFLGDNLDANKLNAEFDRGVLTLTIPVSEASTPRKVEISKAGEGRQAIQTESRPQQTVSA